MQYVYFSFIERPYIWQKPTKSFHVEKNGEKINDKITKKKLATSAKSEKKITKKTKKKHENPPQFDWQYSIIFIKTTQNSFKKTNQKACKTANLNYRTPHMLKKPENKSI